MIQLSVNVNKIALLRNSREGTRPDLLEACRTVLRAGAVGITVHPRPDQRHIRASDVPAIAHLIASEFPDAEFNIEGNPFAPANASGYPGMLELVREAQPTQVTLVPDSDDQLTSDHGFDLPADIDRLAPLVRAMREYCQRVSLFLDADADAAAQVPATGADRIEIYTGPFADAWLADDRRRGGRTEQALAAIEACAASARAHGIGINAGHDLDLDNLVLLRDVEGLAEVSIGHALMADALDGGLYGTVQRYLAVLHSRSQISAA